MGRRVNGGQECPLSTMRAINKKRSRASLGRTAGGKKLVARGRLGRAAGKKRKGGTLSVGNGGDKYQSKG